MKALLRHDYNHAVWSQRSNVIIVFFRIEKTNKIKQTKKNYKKNINKYEKKF